MNTTVAFSGGKCSQVALHLTLKKNPDVLVNFNDTTNEYQETYAHVEKIWDD